MGVSHPKSDIYIGPGRLVQGSLHEVVKKDPQNRDLTPDKYHIFFAVAVKKDQGSNAVAQQIMMNTAWAGYQNLAGPAGEIRKGMADPNTKFRWKMEDGDHPDNAKKEGMAGCWIYKFSTNILELPKTCDAQNQPIDRTLIKRGYWVDVKGSTSINGNVDDTAGIYMNPIWVRFLDYGPEILGGQSAEDAFKGMPPAVGIGTGAPVAAGQPGGALPPAPAAAPQIAPPAPPAGAAAGVPPGQVPPTVAAPAVPGGTMPMPPAASTPAPSVPANASLTNPPAGVTPQPGFAAGPAPAPVPPAPPAPPAPSVAQPVFTAAQIAAHYNVTHYPGHRYNPTTNAYDPDPTSV